MEKNVFNGGVFCNQLIGGKAYGELTITNDSIYLHHETIELKLPLDGIHIRAGGAGGNMFFFTHDSKPDCSFFTSDKAILRHSALNQAAAVIDQIRKIQDSKKRAYAAFIAIILFAAALTYGLFKFKEPAAAAIASRIPPKWEKQFGAAVFDQVKSTYPIIDDEEITAALKQIAAPVFKSIQTDRYEFSIHAAKHPLVNAFALPGGYIVINTGLLLSAESPEEIAAVVAHEASHIILQHGLRNLIGSTGIYLLLQALFGDVEGVLGAIMSNGAYLINMKYSRDYEREADDSGWDFLVNAGIDPLFMISFFQKLLKEENKKMPSETNTKVQDALSYISTHPSTSERIARLQRKQLTTSASFSNPYTEFDFKEFQKKLR